MAMVRVDPVLLQGDDGRAALGNIHRNPFYHIFTDFKMIEVYRGDTILLTQETRDLSSSVTNPSFVRMNPILPPSFF
ncbi:MAG: hypothetical protein MZV49_04845 [Rhodopseudomonas palustris]|nr:hypothetical protein [Rhodopseudomonas palustris]